MVESPISLFPLSISLSSPHYFGRISLKTYLVMLLLGLQTFSDFLLPVEIKFKPLFVAGRAPKLCPWPVSLVASLTASRLTLWIPANGNECSSFPILCSCPWYSSFLGSPVPPHLSCYNLSLSSQKKHLPELSLLFPKHNSVCRSLLCTGLLIHLY